MKPCNVTRIGFLLLLVLGISTAMGAEGKFEYPLGPIGGKFKIVEGTNLVRVIEVTPSAPGDLAGIQADDFIFGAGGMVFDVIGSDFQGSVRQLGAAIDEAEGNDGQLKLMVTRAGVGTLNLTVSLPTLGALLPAYPLTSAKYDAAYEYACSELHQRVMQDADGDLGYPTGFIGLALLGHPNSLDVDGEKPYRLSINRIRDVSVSRINSAIYAPVENLLLDGSANPNYQSEPEGLASWALGLGVMFLSEYYGKTSDASVFDTVQRGAELMANRFQWWKQPAQNANGYSPGYDEIAGMVSHGGVTGDYVHIGWGGGINMVGVHVFSGLAMAKRAGVDMSVRPRDGHYFGYETAPPNAVPVGMETYDHSLDEKFAMAWNWFLKCSRDNPGTMDDGSVGYTISQGGSPYDAGGRVPGVVLGMGVYHDGSPPSPEERDRWERQKGYIARNHDRHMNAHAYNMGGTMFQALAMPYLGDREQRFILHNWRFYYNLSREPNGSLTFFHARSIDESYQNLPLCALVNTALPRSVARGGLPHVPGFDANRLFARFKTPEISWPRLEARHLRTTSAIQSLDVEVLDSQGTVMAPSSYTASWSVVSGPAMNVTFVNDSHAGATVTFPESGRYQIQLAVTSGPLSVVEPIDCDVFLATLPEGWTAGEANYEVYTNLAGNAVSDLTTSDKYINEQPDIRRRVSNLEGDYSGNSYGARLNGYLIPAVTGTYEFAIASDDQSEFWLDALDGNGLSKRCAVTSWTNSYQWDRETGQRSTGIILMAGQRYPYQALHKEGAGGDHLSVGWIRPGSSTIEVIGTGFLALPSASVANAAILTQPVDQSIALGDNATFTLVAEGPEPRSYQWRLNGISYWPPSSEPNLDLVNVGGGQAGQYDCVYTAGDQVVISSAAILSFTDVDFGKTIKGGLWRETYSGIDSGDVTALKDSSKFPYHSDSSNVIEQAEVPSEQLANDFGQRWTGWLVPKESAAYRFYLTADDSAELWLSVDAFEGHKSLVTSRPSAVSPRAWTSVTPSQWIPLEAGQRYFLELLAQENGGSEHAAIAWQKQGDPALVNGDPPIASDVLEYQFGGYYDDDSLAPPVAMDDRFAAIPDQTISLEVLANDLHDHPQTLTITGVSQTLHGAVSIAADGRSLSFTAPTASAAMVALTYTVQDATGQTDVGTIEISVQSLPEDLIAWWKLDDVNGPSVADSSVNGYHGNQEGNVVIDQDGVIDRAFSFDGGSQRVSLPPLAVLGETNTVTFTGWVHLRSGELPEEWSAVYSNHNGPTLNIMPDGQIRYHWSSSSHWGWSSGLYVPSDTWVLVALAVDPDKAVAYMHDGTLSQATRTTAHPLVSFDTVGSLGRHHTAWYRDFKGLMDDVRVYGKTLSESEIASLYSAHRRPEITLSSNKQVGNLVPPTFDLIAAVLENERLIEKVEFFQELVRLGEDAVAPYSLSVVDVPTGNVWFMARVHYQGGIVDSLPLSASVMGAYDYWAYAVHALEGTIALPMADGDGDGVVNLIEYAIGGTPYSEDNPMLPRMQVDTGTQVIFNIDPERHDIVWSLERSFNASDYVEICRIDGSTGQKTMIEGIEVDVTDVTVTVDDHTVSAKTRAFYQLVVVR